jgi:hypothetical protein
MEPGTRIDDLDPAATLRRAGRVLRERRAAEVEDLRLVAHWAGLHGHLDEARARHTGGARGGERLVEIGGDGTPLVAEFALAELAVLREVHPASCRAAAADVLDLQHRLPRTWQVVTSLRCEAWVARKVAVLTRRLDRFAVTLVDRAVAACIAGEAPSRVLAIAEAKTIEADTPGHRARLEAQRRRRYVTLSRTDEYGLRHLIARIHTADAIWIDATLDRTADLIADRHPGATRDQLRAHAMGWLARPAELLELLLTATPTTQPTDEEPGDQPGDQPADEEDPCTGDPVPGEPAQTTPSRTVAFPADLLATLAAIDPARLRPRGRVYLHLHQAAVTGHCPGVARIEESGPVDLTALAELLGHAHLDVIPVLDLADRISVNAYEHPEAIKEHTHLTTPGDTFPHATATTRHLDIDHPDPYRPHGPPGQTGTHNAAPLTRFHHRIKTHTRWASRQTGPGEHVWRTPHGHYRLVDHRGTHPLPEHIAAGLFTTNPLDQALSRLALRHHTGHLHEALRK